MAFQVPFRKSINKSRVGCVTPQILYRYLDSILGIKRHAMSDSASVLPNGLWNLNWNEGTALILKPQLGMAFVKP